MSRDSQSQDKQTVSYIEHIKVLEKVAELERQNELYKQKAPLVGVRWYGEGGNAIHLSYPVAGNTRVHLNGYGAKGVIDYVTWTRMAKTEPAQSGILVRDDSVIDEMMVIGIKATPDATRNPNSFNDDEIVELFNLSMPKFKKIVNSFTSHWGAIHFLKVAEVNKIDDIGKVTLLKDRREHLLDRYRYELLHWHDLVQAAKSRNIPFEGRDKSEVIDDLMNDTK